MSSSSSSKMKKKKVPSNNPLLRREESSEIGNNFLVNIGWRRRPSPPKDASLEGQTVLVTGSNRGIGYEVAKDVIRRGGKLIMVCRDLKGAEEAAKRIKKETGKEEDAIITFYSMDLAKFDTIRECCDKITREVAKIDVLINNAGLLTPTRQENSDGIEITLAVHYYGTVLFTLLLFDLIKKSDFGRVIFVNSLAHHRVDQIFLDDLNWKDKPFSFTVYGHAKLAQMMFIQRLAKKSVKSNVRVYATDPGASRTGAQDNMGGLLGVMVRSPLFKPVYRSVGESSDSVIFPALFSKETEYDPSKFYFCDGKEKIISPVVSEGEDSDQLWEITKATLSLTPKLTEIVEA
jgi:retinol dehydrogenase-13